VFLVSLWIGEATWVCIYEYEAILLGVVLCAVQRMTLWIGEATWVCIYEYEAILLGVVLCAVQRMTKIV
jgi:hypothetical protein